MPYQAQTVP